MVKNKKLIEKFLENEVEEVKDFIKADGTVGDTEQDFGLGYQEINPDELMRNGLDYVQKSFDTQLSSVQKVFGDDMIDFQNVTVQDLEDQIKTEETIIKIANCVIKYEDCDKFAGCPKGKGKDNVYEVKDDKLIKIKTKYSKLIARYAQSIFIRTLTRHHCGSCGTIPRNARVRMIVTPLDIFDDMHMRIFNNQIKDGTEKTLEQIKLKYNTLQIGAIASYRNLVPLCENCEQLYKLKNYPVLEVTNPAYFNKKSRVVCMTKTKLREFRKKNIKKIENYDEYNKPYWPRGFQMDFSRVTPGTLEKVSSKKISLKEFNDEDGNILLDEHVRIALENEKKEKEILEGA